MKNYYPFVKLFSIAILTFCSKVMLFAQPGDCTIDAGLPGYWCPGDTIYLTGTSSGPIQPGSVQWTQIGGSPVLIQNANNLQASVFTNTAGTYIFTVSIGCNIGIAIDTVWHTINSSVNIMDDTVTICPGESAPLQATGAFIYSWSPTSGLVNPDSANPVATPLTSTDYIVTGMSESGNLIYNGDFELGNTGFTSSYTYSATNIGPQSVYGITTNVQLLLGLASPCNDHTSGSGNLMAVNGSGVPNTVVWEETVPVVPNNEYIFSAWVTNWSSITFNLSDLQFNINGVNLGAVFSPVATQCTWTQFYITWNSGPATSAVIQLINQNLVVGGNDFGLDDIHFSRVCTTTDTVAVIIQQPITITQDLFICQGESITVGSNSYNTSGTYTDILQTINGCDSTVITNLIVNNVTASIVSPPSVICSGDAVSLIATGSQYYSWSPASGLSDTTISNPVATPLQTTDYIVTGFSETENLIFNGDFELGNTGFTSSYTYDASNIGPQAVYGITTDVQLLLGLAAPCHDHTTGSGNLMAANGAGVLNTTVWEQTVQVVPQTDYIFSAWVINWSPLTSNLSNLQFSINGQSLGAFFQPLPGPCDWKQFYITWNSGSMSSAVIRLVNQNLTVGGNDFGLDDIHFSRICTTTDTVTVIVEQPVTITQNISICDGQSFQVGTSTYNSPGTYSDFLQSVNGCDSIVITTLSVNNIIASAIPTLSEICLGESSILTASGGGTYLWSDGQTGATITVFPNATTTYSVTVTNNGCTATAETTVMVNATNTSNIDAGLTGQWCLGDQIQLTGSFTGSIQPNVISWIQIGGPAVLIVNSDSLQATALPSADGVYTFTISLSCAQSIISDTVVHTVLSNVMILNTPTSICSGDSVSLMATGSQYYSWSPASGLSNTSIANPIATPLQTTDYVVTGFSETENLILNGDFEMGNTGFTSSYTYSATDIGPQSVYGITTDVQLLLGLAEPCHDHTTGFGNLMAVNGSGVPNTVVWEQTVPVAPNNDYIFSAWVTNWSSIQTNLSNLQFNINGVNLGPVFSPAALQCIWTQFYITWNSSTATSAVIQLINQNLLVGGNDFGLDDIHFSRICTSTDSVSIIVEQPVTITQNISICDGQSFQVGTSTYNSPGTYSDILQSVNGCDSIVVTNLSVNTAIALVTASPSVICVGQNSVLSTSGGGTYAWSNGQSGATINVSPSSTTTYFVTVTNSGCTATGSATVMVNTVNASITASPSVICEGQNAILTASGGGMYSWSNGQTGATISVMPPSTTTYVVTVSNVGCSATAETIIVVNSVTASIVALPPVICAGQNSILTATGGGTYAWSNGESDNTLNVSPLTNTTYTVTVTNNGCSETAQITVAVDSVNATIIITPIDCHGSQNAMIMTSMIGGGTPPYQFSLNGSGLSQDGLFTNLPPGDYQLIVQDANGCEWSSNIEIVDPPLLTIDLGHDTLINYGDIIQIEAMIEPEGVIDTLVWQDPESLMFQSTLFNPFVQPFITTIYSATVIDTNGCTAMDAITVFVEKQRNIFVPNVINPESAFPENSFFTVFGDQAVVQVNILRIYDRWGELIFEKANFVPNDPIANGWNGTFRGLPLDPQVFVWYAEVLFSDGSIDLFKGDVTIIK